ncbi:MAG: PD-(D/E)XK nuclease family protein [Polynucleobacter victoriensis]
MSYRQQHLLAPNRLVIEDLASLIWKITLAEGESPLVLLSTSGPAYGLRQALELARPTGISDHLVFLPRVLGLAQWLKETPGLRKEGPIKSDLERWFEVYKTLSDRSQLSQMLLGSSDASKWALAKNIIEVCDLLSDATLGIFDDVVDSALNDAVKKAYQGASQHIVEFETRIVLAFWEYLSTSQDPVVRQRRAIGLRLNEIKSGVSRQPLIYIETAKGTPGFEKSIAQLWDAYSDKASFHHCMMDQSAVALWPECISSEVSSKDDAVQANREQYFSEISRNNRHVYKASGFEDAAWQGTGAIQDLLHEGHQHIALIAQDRLVARRIRALLARFGKGLSVHDETGWKLSTTRAAASVMSWIDVLRQANGPTSIELMDFLKNPYINWSTWGLSDEQASDYLSHLEKRLIQADVRASWGGILLALQSQDVEVDAVSNLIKKLQELSHKWQLSERACSEWLEFLESDLKELGMFDALTKDVAGQQLLQSLQPMQLLKEYSLKQSEWLSLLSSMFEDASYIESNPRAKASVTILPLSATRLRRFNAWVMVGCDDGQLPSVSDSPMFLSGELKKILGCKTQTMEFEQQAMDLSQLMMSHSHWRMVWQSNGSAGEPKQPSPWLQRLYINHADLLKQCIDVKATAYKPVTVVQPAPLLPTDYVKPASISPSAYRALRECPYRYYVTRLLGLREQNTLDVEVDLSLVGQTLHAALRDFYHGLKTQAIASDNPYEKAKLLKQRLFAISNKHFKPLLEVDGRWLAAWIEWETLIPDWINWHMEREEAGWVFHDGEKPVGFDLLTNFGSIRVSGFVDRLDIHPEYGVEVIDYKYSSKTSINKKKSNIEDDPQLVIYAKAVDGHDLVDGQAVAGASWVSIKEAKTAIQVEDLSEHMNELPAQMIADIEALWGGSPVVASAPDSVCQYCQARGICRKGMWS